MDVEKPVEEHIKKYKLPAIIILSIFLFIYDKKLFFSIFFITLGLLLIKVFSSNIHRKSEEIVKTGIAVGFIFILFGLVLLII